MSKNLIFDIKRYAINDGPGIRLVVFFKGCNLHCSWCHNPESISVKPEKMYSAQKCIHCGSCVVACPETALLLTNEGIITDYDLCTLCRKCAEVCPTKAMEISGKEMSVTEIMEIIENEKVFFDQSGGGVTFSGGEPLFHSEFLIKLLENCGKRGIHRAVDTAGNVNEKIILDVAEHTDLFLYDLKIMDSAMHKKWTGSNNNQILKNLQLLAAIGSNIIIRIPLIAGINDSVDNIQKTAQFIACLAGDRKEVHLLPYHAIAQHKYLKLGKSEDFEILQEPDSETIERVIKQFESVGIKASVGG
jgi:pyruvate formate lyase activating enzyme